MRLRSLKSHFRFFSKTGSDAYMPGKLPLLSLEGGGSPKTIDSNICGVRYPRGFLELNEGPTRILKLRNCGAVVMREQVRVGGVTRYDL